MDKASRGRRHRTRAYYAALCLLVVVTCSAGCRWSTSTTMVTLSTQLPAVQPEDFGFVAAYGIGAENRIDTFAGTFTKDIISSTKPNPTVELRLTPEELADLYEGLRAMGILDYPSDFRPRTGITSSSPTCYRLEIRAGGLWKSVFWDYADLATTTEAQALEDWFKKLQGLIEAKPEYQSMPPLEGLYVQCLDVVTDDPSALGIRGGMG